MGRTQHLKLIPRPFSDEIEKLRSMCNRGHFQERSAGMVDIVLAFRFPSLWEKVEKGDALGWLDLLW
jgi:hypothetical protein